jgi:type VI secretion system secreted protein Hcp
MKTNRAIISWLTELIGSIALAGSFLILPATAQAQSGARNFNVSVDGSKQGIFKADSQKAKIQGLVISYEVKPGQPGRGRAHSLVITKEAGASSPQFFAALFTNEVLKTVTLEFYRASPTGTEEIYQTIKLTSATVLHMKQYTRPGDLQKAQTPLLEDITLAFQHVEISNLTTKTTATDDLK